MSSAAAAAGAAGAVCSGLSSSASCSTSAAAAGVVPAWRTFSAAAGFQSQAGTSSQRAAASSSAGNARKAPNGSSSRAGNSRERGSSNTLLSSPPPSSRLRLGSLSLQRCCHCHCSAPSAIFKSRESSHWTRLSATGAGGVRGLATFARDQSTADAQSAAARHTTSTEPIERRDKDNAQDPLNKQEERRQESTNTQPPSTTTTPREQLTSINELMQLPHLETPIRIPRHPIVLCHGLYGFDVRGPFFGLEIHYWANVMDILRKKMGAEVIMKGVPGTGSIRERAEKLHEFLCSPAAGIRGKKVHFIGHSMGGLDARYLISQIRPKPEEYTPLTLTTINTPHRGSPFMDWCNANVGIGQEAIEKEIKKAQEEGKLQERQGAPEHGEKEGESEEEKRHAVSTSKDDSLADADARSAGIKQEKSAFVPEGKAKREETNKDGTPRPPFSLKEPLFVRRKSGEKEGGNNDASAPQKAKDAASVAVSAASTTAAAAAGQAASNKDSSSDEPSKEVDSSASQDKKKAKKDGKKKDGSEGRPIFTRLLSSISGSFSNYMLSILDQPAYAMLSTRYMAEVFNRTVPDSKQVEYFSIAARVRKLPVWHPLWLPKLILDAAAESRTAGGEVDGSGDALGGALQGNDGLVSVRSAKWGKFLGIVEQADHWDLRGGGAPRLASKINPITGRPYPTQREESQPERSKEEAPSSSSSSWMDINRLLRNLIRGKDKDKVKEEDQTKPLMAAAGTAATTEMSASVAQAQAQAPAQAPRETEKKPESKQDDVVSKVTSFLEHYAEQFTPEGGMPLLDRGRNEAAVAAAVESSSVLQDVAGWISERLPQGDEDRRKQAEQRADEQARQIAAAAAIEQSEQVAMHATMAGFVPDLASQPDTTSAAQLESSFIPSKGSSNTNQDGTKNMQRLVDAGQADKRGPFATEATRWNAPIAADDAGEGKEKDSKKKLSKEQEKLEKFWLAVCHNLWARGY